MRYEMPSSLSTNFFPVRLGQAHRSNIPYISLLRTDWSSLTRPPTTYSTHDIDARTVPLAAVVTFLRQRLLSDNRHLSTGADK